MRDSEVNAQQKYYKISDYLIRQVLFKLMIMKFTCLEDTLKIKNQAKRS